MSRRKSAPWPVAPSWAVTVEKSRDDGWRYRTHRAPLGQMGLAGECTRWSLVREDSRDDFGGTDVGPVEVEVQHVGTRDVVRLPLGHLGRSALVEGLIEANADQPIEGGVR